MTTNPNPAPTAVWVDGDPLMEAIAAAVWERCARDDADMPQLVLDDPRNIAAAAASVARAVILTEAAECAYRIARRLDEQQHDQRAQGAWDVENVLRAELRRLAAEAPTTTKPEDGIRTADLLAESATEYRVPVPEGGGTDLLVRRQALVHGAGWSVAVPGWGGGRAWTAEGWQDSISALSVDRLFCWPDAETAVAEARRALAAGVRQDGAQPCAECSHPKDTHREGDDPVTPGTCDACEAEDPDEARHDHRSEADRG